MKRTRTSRYLAFLLFCMLFIPIIGRADDSGISMTLRRNMGTDMGDGRRIRGDWTISGSGPEGTNKVSILFNETEVYSTQSREFSFRFNTDDYWIGEVNITIRAYISDSEFVSRSVVKEFIDDSFDNMIWAGTGIIFAIIIVILVVTNKKSRSKSKTDVTIDEVKIDG
jgi:hypothetical protein